MVGESSAVVEVLQAEIGVDQPWPDDVLLYQHYQAEQITFPDYANTLSVKTFLHMCGLDFQVEVKTNAEEMSPSGKVPFIRVGAFLISELEPIISFVNAKGFNLSSNLTETQRSEMRAYMALIENVIVNAELYVAWLDEKTSTQVTKVRYGFPYPWPLRWILPWRKQRDVKSRLACNGWKSKTMEEIDLKLRASDEVGVRFYKTLGQNTIFIANWCGIWPTELDAVVFGHLHTLLITSLPGGHFTEIIMQFQNLTDFCRSVDERYFKRG